MADNLPQTINAQLQQNTQVLQQILSVLTQQNRFDVTNQNITRRQIITVPANQQLTVYTSFTSITILAMDGMQAVAPATDVFTRFNQSGQPDCEIFAGKQVKSPVPNLFLTQVTFVNNNATDVTIDFECGFFETIDNRLNLVSGLTIAPNQTVGILNGANAATGQVSVGTTATLITPGNSQQRCATIQNMDSAATMFIGTTAVSTTTGYRLLPGMSHTFNVNRAIYGVVASGTANACYFSEDL